MYRGVIRRDRRGRKDTKREGKSHERRWTMNTWPGETPIKKPPMSRTEVKIAPKPV